MYCIEESTWTLLELFGNPRSDSAPQWWFGAWVIVSPLPLLVTPLPLLRFQNENIMEDVKKLRSSLWFSLATGPTLKKLWACAGSTQAVSIERVSLRRLVGVARGPIGGNRSNRLKVCPAQCLQTSCAVTANLIFFRTCKVSALATLQITFKCLKRFTGWVLHDCTIACTLKENLRSVRFS